MKTISIIQADELGPDFRLEGGIWKVNFPAGNEPIKVISDDEGNAIKKGTDGGGFISENLLSAYALVQDTSAQKIHLYSFPAGTEFDVATATLVSTVNLIEMSGVFDDVAIDDAVLTFTDADTGQTLSLDTRTLQRIGDVKAGEGITVSELNGVLTIAVKLLDSTDNLIQNTSEGLLVSKQALQGLVEGSGVGDFKQKVTPMNNGEELCVVVGDEHLVIPQMAIANTKGEIIVLFDDIPEDGLTSIKADETHCTDSDWDVKYVLKSTGETVKLKTGPVVTRELIDPDVDFEDAESASYLAWEENVADRSELYIHRNVTTVKSGAFAYWVGLEKVHTDATELESSAFASSTSITEFVCLPNTRRILGTMVSGCQFTKLEFNEGLQKLHSECFAGCNFPGGTLIIPDSITQYVGWKWNDDYTEKSEVPVTGLTAIFGVEKLIIGGGVPKTDNRQWGSMLGYVKYLEFRPGVTHIIGAWSMASETCETLILPQGLLEIGSASSGYTFGDFNKLKELTIPGTVQYISGTCFQSMKMLEKLTIERGVGFISPYAFQNFGSKWSNQPHPLKEFNFLGGTVIGEGAFQNWYLADSNFEIVIPDTVTEIKKNAFQNHDVTKSLRFAEGCQADVGYYAFGNWFKAEKLYISDSVKSINGSFGQWYRGRELYIGKGIKALGAMVDSWGNGNLRLEGEFTNWGSDYSNPALRHLASKMVIIPDNVETILELFAGTPVVDTLIVSKGVKTLGNISSPYIKNLYLRSPEAPTIIEYSRLLAGAPGQAVYVPSLVGYDSVVNKTFTTYTPPLNSSDPHGPTPIVVQPGDWDVQYTDLETGIVHTVSGAVRGIIDDNFAEEIDSYLIDDVVIGINVTHIGAQAFAGMNSIKRVQFQGNNLKSIGIAAFAGCFVYGGYDIVLPDSVERLGASVITNVEQIKSFRFGPNLKSVAVNAVSQSDKFATPSKLLPPAPTFVSNTTTTITGTALAGDTIVGSIKRGEETIELPPTPVGEDGNFTIDLSTLEEPVTIQSGDNIGLVVLDIVKNVSTPSLVIFM